MDNEPNNLQDACAQLKKVLLGIESREIYLYDDPGRDPRDLSALSLALDARGAIKLVKRFLELARFAIIDWERIRLENDARCAKFNCDDKNQLQWKWRNAATLPTEFDAAEAEAALLDAFIRQGGANVWPGDGSGCAMQIVQAVWNRNREAAKSYPKKELAQRILAKMRSLHEPLTDSPELRDLDAQYLAAIEEAL